MDETNKVPTGVKLGLYVGGSILLIMLLVAIAPFKQVEAGERVVVTHLGKVDRVLENGFHWINPFTEDTHTYDVQKQIYSVTAEAASSDLQNVSTEVAVNFRLNDKTIAELYASLGDNYETKILVPSVQEAVKSATSKYTAEQLITKREIVKDDIQKALINGVNKKANDLVVVEDISITNFKFSAGFDRAIESKVTAEQEALKAKNELEKVKFEAEQKVAQAQAEAQSIRLQSDAANNPRFVELKQLEVQLEFAKKWNGQLPTNLYGSAPIPFLQLGN